MPCWIGLKYRNYDTVLVEWISIILKDWMYMNATFSIFELFFTGTRAKVLYLKHLVLNIMEVQFVSRKGFGEFISAVWDSMLNTVYLSIPLYTHTADPNSPNPFRGTHCWSTVNINSKEVVHNLFNYIS